MTRHWSDCLLQNKKRWKEKAVEGTINSHDKILFSSYALLVFKLLR